MRRRVVYLFLAAATFMAPPLFAQPDLAEDVLKANRAQLEERRKHPEQLEQMRRDLRAFMALPPERRAQLLKLDRDLQEAAMPARLWNILDRYTKWLDRLPEAQREAIRNAPTKADRIAKIRELREEEWIRRQPEQVQKELSRLDDKARPARIKELRKEEQDQQEQWRLAGRLWNQVRDGRPMPIRLADLDAKDREGVREYLLPFLSEAEKDRLEKAEGQWPAYLVTLVEIADRHPLALPSANGPTSVKDLPKALRLRFEQRIQNPFNQSRLLDMLHGQADGRPWPTLAIRAVELNRNYLNNTPFDRELWASNFESLLPPMREYVDTVLRPRATSAEWERVLQASNKWPDYPRAIQDLAEAYKLSSPPWETALYGPRPR